MIIQNWDRHCNQKAYGQSGNGQNNTTAVNFESGRIITYNKNSRTLKEHVLSFRFDDTQNDPVKLIEGKTEFQWFLFWCDNILHGIADAFYFPDIIGRQTIKVYKLKDYPRWKGQAEKVVNVTFYEV